LYHAHGQNGAHSWACGEVLLWWMVVSNSFIHMIIYIKRTRYRYRSHGHGRHKGVLASIIIENMITYRTCVSPHQDTQEHLLVCSKLNVNNVLAASKISHDDIYGDVSAQKTVVSVYTDLLNRRNKLMEEQTN
jgi:hypothetical protein